jgi:hypothetical protein
LPRVSHTVSVSVLGDICLHLRGPLPTPQLQVLPYGCLFCYYTLPSFKFLLRLAKNLVPQPKFVGRRSSCIKIGLKYTIRGCKKKKKKKALRRSFHKIYFYE